MMKNIFKILIFLLFSLVFFGATDEEVFAQKYCGPNPAAPTYLTQDQNSPYCLPDRINGGWLIGSKCLLEDKRVASCNPSTCDGFSYVFDRVGTCDDDFEGGYNCNASSNVVNVGCWVYCSAHCDATPGACGADGCGPNEKRTGWSNCTPGIDTGICGSSCVDDGSCCSASCSPACGQADGCGGTCSSSSSGTPGVPVLSPGNGGSVTITEGEQVEVTWSIPNLTDSYELEIYPTGTDCSSLAADCTTVGTNSYSFDPVVSSYDYKVRALNDTCSTQWGEWSSVASFTVNGIVTGQVKYDPDSLATLVGGVCVLGGTPGVEPGSGSSVVVSGSYLGSVDGSGNYSVTSLTGVGLQTVLVPGEPTWTCTCPAGCVYSADSPKDDLDYFVTDFQQSWFQVEGGNIHADFGNVSSIIPDTCVGICNPYLITSDGSGTTGAVSYTGTVGVGSGGVSEDGNDWQLNTDFQGRITGYAYFNRILQEDSTEIGTWNGLEPIVSGVYLGEGATRTSGGDWSVSSGTTMVLLVPNDIVIDNNINVDVGGFLAIISSGSITIADSVTNVEGVYIADGILATCESSECGNSGGAGVSGYQLTLEGIFVGWSGIDLRRNFLSIDNDTNPGEVFVYRPDLQANAYTYLLRPHYTWGEVAP